MMQTASSAFYKRTASQSPVRISQDATNGPSSNYFGGTFHRASQEGSPHMLQSKFNEQKLRVIKSNKKLQGVNASHD